EGNVRVAQKAVLDLVNNEVVALMFAPFGASEVTFSGADLGLAGIPTISASSLDTTTKPKPYPQLFPVTPPESVLARAAVTYARSQHWASVAAVGENNPAGVEGVADFSADAAKAGLSVTGTAHGSDIQSELRTLQGGNPQGLFVAGDDLGVGAILSARQSSGWNVPVVAPPVAADAPVVSALGPAGAAGVAVIAPKPLVVSGPHGIPSDPTMVAFLSALRRKVGPSAFSGSVDPYAEAYDGIELLAYVATSINSILPGDIRTFIENANYQGLLANYNYTSAAHIGVGTSQLEVVALSSLSGGLFHT
ncbi:MAG: ABC transporter substrate-binding protein, partial [Acidimicrobiales bacterium]